jgi:hypothetical protein
MSHCNLGRPPQDTGLQNLIVNDTLRVNKLLKASKAEVDRLCADIATTAAQTPPTIFEGSLTLSDLPPTEGFDTFNFPVGSTIIDSNTPNNPSIFTTIWTDEELVIDDFRAVAYGPPNQTTPIIFDLSVVAAPTIGGLSVPIGTNILTLPFSGLNSVSNTPVSLISSVVPLTTITIPAGSYVSVRFTMPLTETSLFMNVSWSIRLQ